MEESLRGGLLFGSSTLQRIIVFAEVTKKQIRQASSTFVKLLRMSKLFIVFQSCRWTDMLSKSSTPYGHVHVV
jgi:hypothetical protein